MNQFKTTSLADQVFEKLENDIIQGVYPRGEILTELKLVDQLGVSRTPSGRRFAVWNRSGLLRTPAKAPGWWASPRKIWRTS